MTATATAGATLTHPRIRQRRAAVQDENLRQRNRRLLVAGALVLAGLIAAASTQSPLLDVDEIRVIGAVRHSPEFVRELAELQTGEPLMGLDLAAVEERLVAVAGIAAVDVEKDWHGVVTIEVHERVAGARFVLDDATTVVATDGTVLEVTRVPHADLPLITGAMFSAAPGDTVPGVVNDALTVATSIPVDIAPIIERVELSVDTLAIVLTGGGARIDLGDARNLNAKFDAIRAFVAQVELNCLDMLNVRAPTVPVITRTSGCR